MGQFRFAGASQQLLVARLGSGQVGFGGRQFCLAGAGLDLGQVFLSRGQAGLRRGDVGRVGCLQQLVQLSLSIGQVQLGLGHRSLQVGGVQGQQQIILGHLVTHLDGDLGDDATHLQHHRPLAAELDVASSTDAGTLTGGADRGGGDVLRVKSFRRLGAGRAAGQPVGQAQDIASKEEASSCQHNEGD